MLGRQRVTLSVVWVYVNKLKSPHSTYANFSVIIYLVDDYCNIKLKLFAYPLPDLFEYTDNCFLRRLERVKTMLAVPANI